MFGTAQMLFEHNGDQIFDVTPVSASASLTNAFSVAVSANVVTVSATAQADAINPALTDDDFPQKLFDAKLYTGDGGSSTAITGVGFQPDWVWIT